MSDDQAKTETSREWMISLDGRVTRLEVQVNHLSTQTQHLEDGIKALRAEMAVLLDRLSNKIDALYRLLLIALATAFLSFLVLGGQHLLGGS